MNRNYSRGIFHMVVAAFAFSTMTAFVKFASETMPPFEVVFFRSVFGSLMIGAVIWKEKVSFLGANRRMLVLRGIFGFIALAMNFYAIAKLNLGMAVMLNSTSPIFVAIFASLLLKDRITPRLWLLTLICFVGVYLLIGPQFSARPFPILIGLLSGVMAAAAFVTISAAEENESSYTIIFYFTMISTIGTAPLLHFGFVPLGAREWLGIIGVSIASFFGQVFITKSYREAPASLVSPFNYLTPVCSFLYGFLIWKDAATLQMIAGAGLIIVSGILIYLLEKKSKPMVE